MEQSRLLIAIALSFLIFFLWSITFGPKPSDQAVEQTQENADATHRQKQVPAARPDSAEVEQSAAAKKEGEGTLPQADARRITVNTPLYRMVISERGAAVVSMVLKNYQETVRKDSPAKELIPKGLPGGTVLLSMTGISGDDLLQGVYKADKPENVTIQDAPGEVRFSYQTPDNLRIEKIYRFAPDNYLIDLMITVRNGSDKALGGALKIAIRDMADKDQGAYGFEGPSGLINNQLEQIKIKDIEEQKILEGKIRWIAIERLYFMESLISKVPADARMVLAYENNVLENNLLTSFGEINPSDQRTFEFSLFLGPKSLSVLRAANNELDRAIDFGWVDFIAKPCLWFMNFIYRFIPNYGVAIMILTIVTRLLFWPLAQKSYKSMNDMRKLQPLMQKIREKYKNDKAKINQETMALYRTYKINPLGGCLPMLIQLPVFFALYRMLYQALELRHAPFFGWINDLSAPDRLFNFAFKIPFMEPPFGIPVLTLIMGATMILQQKMSPAPGDPTQAKMMMLMPIVFTFIFINFPSGLVLYWLVSNLVSIAQQYYTQKRLA
ncbi:MAG: membrane protein insertase YidC [Desulfobacteraceae bacterium]|nr:MAG: membrane protein insertase YidC [Desulfobacteraceae bacterium]